MAAPIARLLKCSSRKISNLVHKSTFYRSAACRSLDRQSAKINACWHQRKQEVEALPTVQERLLENIGAGNQLFYSNTLAFDLEPYLLEYQEKVCKAEEERELHDELPAILSGDQKLLNKLVKEELEKVISYVHMRFRKRTDKPQNELDSEMVSSMLYTIFTRMLSIASKSHRGVIDYEVDRNVLSQTHWIRGDEFDRIEHSRCKVWPSGIRFGYKQNVTLQVRGSKPLRPSPHTGENHNPANHETLVDLENADDSLLKTSFDPKHYGQIPLAYSLPHSPGFEYGSVNPHVHISVITPPTIPLVGLKPNITANHRGAGIVHSFATLHATAHCLGFDMFHDLTYPLRTRTVATDGRLFSVTNFQLNTINLFVENNRHNLYNTSELLPLYENVDVNGEVSGVSPDVLESLTSLLTPTLLDGVPTNPYISEGCSTPSGPTDQLLPYLPRYERMMDIPDLEAGSAPIPTFKRYTSGSAEPREWDLPRAVRLRRKEEKEHTFKYNRGPMHDRISPVARGKTDLTLKLREMRDAEKKHREEYREKLETLERNERLSGATVAHQK